MAVQNNVSDAELKRRIAARLENSGAGAMPDLHTKHGEGPTRVHHNIHHAGHKVAPGTAAKESDGKVDSTSDSRGGKQPAGWDLKR
jgi:hypothetical protein